MSAAPHALDSADAGTPNSADTAPAPSDASSLYRDGARLIARFARTHPMPMTVSVIGAFLYSGSVVVGTIVLGRITDKAIEPAFREGVAASTLWWSFVAVVVMALLRGAGVVIRRYFAAMLEISMQSTLRRGVVDKYLGVPLSYYQSKPTGELLSHTDADVVGTTTVIKPLPFSIGVAALIVFAFASLLAADWTFAVIALVMFPTITVMYRIYSAKAVEPIRRSQERIAHVSAVAHESFDGALVVKTLGIADVEADRFASAADALRDERIELARLRAIYEPLLAIIPSVGTIVLFLVGAWRIDSGAASTGDLVQAASMFSLLSMPMSVFGFFLQELPRAVVSIRRVDAVLDVDDDIDGAERPAIVDERGPVGVSFRDVQFSYDGHEVLRGVNVDIAPGETVALVGATGTGKSTINELLARLMDPTSGSIEVGGHDLATMQRSAVAGLVTVAFQESFLFSASVRDNITSVAPDHLTSDEIDAELARVAHAARVDRFIDRLPEGWDTVVGERGVTLSGGQRQRVALARALMAQPRVLVLDDATSAVDPTIEAEILANLRSHDATLMIVAHRLSTILLADRVLYLDGGRIVATGPHEELLTLPDYAALVHAYEEAEVDEHVAGETDGEVEP